MSEVLEKLGQNLGANRKWVIFIKRGALYQLGGTFSPEGMKECVEEIRDHCDRLIDNGTLDFDNYEQYE